jgi:predicted Rdx family selenoprotein
MSEGNPRLPDLEADSMRDYGSPATPSPGAGPATTGCGCVPVLAAPMAPVSTVPAAADPTITICITPTTGGQFDITVDKHETIENLKKIISKRLKVAKERICLLNRERSVPSD